MKKHDYDKVLNRRISIWNRLRQNEEVLPSDLAREFNVSEITVLRDLKDCLYPILPIEKADKVWRVQKGCSDDIIDRFEATFILDILQELAKSVSSDLAHKSETIFSRLQNSHTNPIYSKLEIDDISNKTRLFDELQKAIEEHSHIRCRFNSRLRQLEPYKITILEGYWYLYAKDLSDDKFKIIYLKEIQNLSVLASAFAPDTKAKDKIKNALNRWFDPNGETFEVTLLISKSSAKYFQRHPLNSSQKILTHNEDGTMHLAVTLSSKKELFAEIKKWQPHVLILEPKKLAKELIKDTQSYIELQRALV
jgi:predicted DNA-binding transcriptional regulator YafY